MAQKRDQRTFIDVGKGIAEQVEARLLPAGSLLKATGSQYTKLRRLTNARGGTALPTPSNDGGIHELNHDGASIVRIGNTGTKPIQELAEGSINTWTQHATETSQTAIKCALTLNVRPRRRPVKIEAPKSSGGASGDFPVYTSQAVSDGYLLIAYEKNGTVREVMTDAATGALLWEGSTSNAIKPRVVAFSNSSVAVFYADTSSNEVKMRVYVDPDRKAHADGTVHTVGAVSSTSGEEIFTATQNPNDTDTAYVAINDGTDTDLYIFRYTGATVASDTISTVAATRCLAWLDDDGGCGRAILFLGDGSNTAVYVRDGGTLASVATRFLVGAADAHIINASGYTTSNDATGEYCILYSIWKDGTTFTITQDTHDTYVRYHVRTTSTTSNGVFALSVSLQSEMFSITSLKKAALFAYTGNLTTGFQSYFLLDTTGHGISDVVTTETARPVQARIMPGEARGLDTERPNQIGRPVALPDGTTGIAVERAVRAQTNGENAGTIDIQYAVDLVTVENNPTLQKGIQAGGMLVVPGGIFRGYDGRFFGEIGEQVPPEQITSITTSAAAGSMSEGVYKYTYIYVWVDNSGRKHRTQPAVVKEVTVGAGENQADVEIPQLRLTSKSLQNFGGFPSYAAIELYRTKVGGSLFYLQGRADLVNLTIARLTVSDGVSDTDLESGEQLYTQPLLTQTNQALQNETAPATAAVAMYRNRLVVINAEVPSQIWFSKELKLKFFPGFSSSLILDLPPVTKATALASFDDRLVILTENDGIYVVSGTPPNDLGIGTMPPAQKVSAETCDNPRSVVLQDGVWFQNTDKKIRRLSRDLRVSQIGDAAEDLIGTNDVLDAIYLPARSQVRFYVTGSTPTYDTRLGLWTDYGTDATDVTVDQGRAVYATGPTTILREDTDNSAGPTPVVEFPWFAPAGPLGGFQLRSLQLLGEATAASGTARIAVRLYYDYEDDTHVEQLYWTLTASDPATFSRQLYPGKRRCTAVKVRVLLQDAASDIIELSGIEYVWAPREEGDYGRSSGAVAAGSFP